MPLQSKSLPTDVLATRFLPGRVPTNALNLVNTHTPDGVMPCASVQGSGYRSRSLEVERESANQALARRNETLFKRFACDWGHNRSKKLTLLAICMT